MVDLRTIALPVFGEREHVWTGTLVWRSQTVRDLHWF